MTASTGMVLAGFLLCGFQQWLNTKPACQSPAGQLSSPEFFKEPIPSNCCFCLESAGAWICQKISFALFLHSFHYAPVCRYKVGSKKYKPRWGHNIDKLVCAPLSKMQASGQNEDCD